MTTLCRICEAVSRWKWRLQRTLFAGFEDVQSPLECRHPRRRTDRTTGRNEGNPYPSAKATVAAAIPDSFLGSRLSGSEPAASHGRGLFLSCYRCGGSGSLSVALQTAATAAWSCLLLSRQRSRV